MNPQAEIDQLKLTIEKDFGIKLDFLTQTTSGQVSNVYHSKLNGEDVFIKFTKSFNSYPKEIFYYNSIRHLPIDVPKIIAYKEKPDLLGFPTMIISKISGKPVGETFRDKSIPEDIILEMGNLLNKIHTIRTKGFGYIDQNVEGLEGPYDNLPDFYNENYKFFEKFSFLHKGGWISEEDLNKLNEIYSNILNTKYEEPMLIYNDFQPAHIFTDGKHITGLIDPGNSFSCVKEHDIGLSLLFLDQKYWNSFLKGYGYSNNKLALEFSAILTAHKAAGSFKSNGSNKGQKRIEILKVLLNELKFF